MNDSMNSDVAMPLHSWGKNSIDSVPIWITLLSILSSAPGFTKLIKYKASLLGLDLNSFKSSVTIDLARSLLRLHLSIISSMQTRSATLASITSCFKSATYCDALSFLLKYVSMKNLVIPSLIGCFELNIRVSAFLIAIGSSGSFGKLYLKNASSLSTSKTSWTESFAEDIRMDSADTTLGIVSMNACLASKVSGPLNSTAAFNFDSFRITLLTNSNVDGWLLN